MILMSISIGIGQYENILLVIYRIGRFEKWDLSVLIGIGRNEKKHISRTLSENHLTESTKYLNYF